jgi:type VI secretion system secreted protein Hcp
VQYYTVKLINASITSIRAWKANTMDPEGMRFPDMEEVQFSYQRIIWTYEDGGITAEDDTEPVVQ